MDLKEGVEGALADFVAEVACESEEALIEDDTIVTGGVFGSSGRIVDFESTGSFLTTMGFSFFGMIATCTRRVAKRVDYHNMSVLQNLLVNQLTFLGPGFGGLICLMRREKI